MGTLRTVVVFLWWIALALLPFGLWHGIDEVFREIGCPPRGDCYQPGWMAAFNLDLWVMGLAALVWPACVWNLGVGWLIRRAFGLEPPNSSSKPTPLRGAA